MQVQVYKCDICGKLFDNFIPLELLKKQIFIKSPNKPFVKGKVYDVCPDCTSAIQKAIDERSKENEQHNA